MHTKEQAPRDLAAAETKINRLSRQLAPMPESDITIAELEEEALPGAHTSPWIFEEVRELVDLMQSNANVAHGRITQLRAENDILVVTDEQHRRTIASRDATISELMVRGDQMESELFRLHGYADDDDAVHDVGDLVFGRDADDDELAEISDLNDTVDRLMTQRDNALQTINDLEARLDACERDPRTLPAELPFTLGTISEGTIAYFAEYGVPGTEIARKAFLAIRDRQEGSRAPGQAHEEDKG